MINALGTVHNMPFFLRDHWQMLRHQYLVGPLGCRHLVGTAEFNPISREMPGTLRFRYLTGAAAFFFFFFFSFTAIPAAVAEFPSLCPRVLLSQGRSECCRKTEGKSRTKEPPMQHNAVFKVLRARMKGRSHFQQDEETSELVQARKKVLRMKRGRTEEPSLGFGDSEDAGLVLTVEMIPYLCNLGPLGLT